MAIIEIKNLKVVIEKKIILQDINLSFENDKVIGIIGPNGGGKTTLLKVILGLSKPTEGKIEIFGKDISKIGELRSKIGYVAQNSHVEKNFPANVFEIVMMGKYSSIGLLKLPKKEDIKAVEKALDDVDMLEYKNQLFSDLSGGQKQRVLIARSLVNNPQLLILDEPTTGIDSPGQDKFYKDISKLKNIYQNTILIVSHDIGVISKYIDEVICLNQTVFYHGGCSNLIDEAIIGKAYGCEIELLAHGKHPHRILEEH